MDQVFRCEIEELPLYLPGWKLFIDLLPETLGVPANKIRLDNVDDRGAHQFSPGDPVPGLMVVWEKPCPPAQELNDLLSVSLDVESRVRRLGAELRKKDQALKAIAGMVGEKELAIHVAELRRQAEGDRAELKVLRDRERVLEEEIQELQRDDNRKILDLVSQVP
jgi:hypothetical protein